MRFPHCLAWLLPKPSFGRLLTPRAKQTLALSRRVAVEHNASGAVDTGHLLAALLRLNQGSIIHILRSAGIDAEKLRISLERPGAAPATPEEAMKIPFLPCIKSCLAAARGEAGRMKHSFIGTEHLLLGMLSCGKGPAAEILASHELAVELVREVIREMPMEQPLPPSPMKQA